MLKNSQCVLNISELEEDKQEKQVQINYGFEGDSSDPSPRYTPIDPDSFLTSSKPKAQNQEKCNLNGIHNGIHQKHDEDLGETELFQRLIHEAPFQGISQTPESSLQSGISQVLGSSSNHKIQSKSSNEKCPDFSWLSPQLISDGRRFAQKHFFTIFISHFIGIALLFTIKPIQSLLLRTIKGGIHQEKYSLRRHLNTLLRIKGWYESEDLMQNPRSILTVRDKFAQKGSYFRRNIPPPASELLLDSHEASTLMSLKEEMQNCKVSETGIKSQNEKIFSTINPMVPASQYDLMCVQFAFVGLLTLYPRVFGLHGRDLEKNLQGFIHLWAFIGKMLGLEDRFNLCLPSNFDYKTNQLIFKRIFFYSFSLSDHISLRLIRVLSHGASRASMPFGSYKVLIKFILRRVYRIKSSTKKGLKSTLSLCEKMSYFMLTLTLNWLIRFSLIRMLLNVGLRATIIIANSWYFKVRKKNIVRERSIDISVIYGSRESI